MGLPLLANLALGEYIAPPPTICNNISSKIDFRIREKQVYINFPLHLSNGEVEPKASLFFY